MGLSFHSSGAVAQAFRARAPRATRSGGIPPVFQAAMPKWTKGPDDIWTHETEPSSSTGERRGGESYEWEQWWRGGESYGEW